MTSLRLSWRFVNRRMEAIFLSECVCVCCVCLFSVNIRLDSQKNKPHNSWFKFSQSSLEVESLTAVSSQQGSQRPATSSSTTLVIYYNSSCFFFLLLLHLSSCSSHSLFCLLLISKFSLSVSLEILKAWFTIAPFANSSPSFCPMKILCPAS